MVKFKTIWVWCHIDTAEHEQRAALPLSPWRRRMGLFTLGGWLGAMWLFGGIITAGLLSFNLDAVRAGDQTLPYMFAAVGYTGLWLTIIAFVARFQLSMSARAWRPAGGVTASAVPEPV